MNQLNYKKCECCEAIYSTGKTYGDFWQEFDIGRFKDVEIKGLCGFCNPNNEKWYIQDKQCHKKTINNITQSFNG